MPPRWAGSLKGPRGCAAAPDRCPRRVPQGIDLKAGGRNKTVHRTAPKSENPYVKLLVKVRGGAGAVGRLGAAMQARYKPAVEQHWRGSPSWSPADRQLSA